MDVHSKVLDAYVRKLSTAALHGSLRTLQVQTRLDGELDAHESEFARAYRVKQSDGSPRCLRFWKSVPPEPSFLAIYSALERSPPISDRLSLPKVTLLNEAITVRGTAIPAVLMDWMEGLGLGDYLAYNLSKPAELRSTADALLQLFTIQNDGQISHGDLRASNILVRSNADVVHIGMIDLDSFRWSDGPSLPRTVGGNPAWDELRRQHGVTPLEYDYLDQAMIYLTFIALSLDSSRWPGSTDDFLTLGYLRGDPDETLTGLEQLAGPPGRIAASVRRVLHARGHWLELHSAMAEESQSAPLKGDVFWRRTLLRVPASQPAPPPQPTAAPLPPRMRTKHRPSTPATPGTMSPPPPPSSRRPVRGLAGISRRLRSRQAWKWAFWIAGIIVLLVVAYYIWKKPGPLFSGDAHQVVYLGTGTAVRVS